MKRIATLLPLVGLLGLAGTAEAKVGTVDNVPAATLLLPYFEVNLADVNGITTLLSINNASATAVLAHFTMYSDLSVPTLAFNIYLTGYDVQTVNLRDIFNGNVPRTASAGQDPSDIISPHGAFSQDINFASCTGQLPPPPLPPSYIDHIRRSHTGLSTPFYSGRCAGRAFGDNIARGYITVDTVNNCTLRVAGNPGYFAPGGTGDATNQNIIWGDYLYVNPGQNFAQGDALVHIEAAPGTGVGGSTPSDPETSVPGQYTFYGRYVSWTAADNREPLGSKWAARFVNGGAFSGGTSLTVWRDAKRASVGNPLTDSFVCGVPPTWFPLSQEDVYDFNEQETAENVLTGSPQPFPAAAQRTRVDGPALGVTPIFGWLYLNLNTTVAAAGSNPPEDPVADQSFATNVMDASGRFSVGFQGNLLESAKTATHVCINGSGSPPCP